MSEVTSGATPTPAQAEPQQPATGNPATPATPGATPNPPSDNLEPTSQNATLAELHEEIASLKARVKELNGESKQHRLTGKQATDQVAALTAELEAWKALGETPGKVRESIEKGAQAISRAEQYQREKAATDAAATLGYKADVLSDLAASKGFAIEMREVEQEGKKAQQPFAVIGEGESAQAKPLREHVEGELSAYIPALVASGQPQLQRPVWLPQPSGGEGSNKPTDVVGSTLQSRYKRPDK